MTQDCTGKEDRRLRTITLGNLRLLVLNVSRTRPCYGGTVSTTSQSVVLRGTEHISFVQRTGTDLSFGIKSLGIQPT